MTANQGTVRRALDEVICTIGPLDDLSPVDLSGYGSGGALEITTSENLHSLTVGQDGAVSIDKNLNEVVNITVTLLQTSLTYKKLGGMAQRQYETGIIDCPFFLRDRSTGDELASQNTIFLTEPDLSHEQEAVDRSLELALPHAKPNMVFGGKLS